MNSIYKQLDKIDDNKSLNEKWNVKNQRELRKLKENFKVRQYSLDWDGEYEWADEETFDTMDEAQIRFNELKEVIDNGEFDYAAIALVDENDDDISIYGEPERQKVTKEDVIEYLRDREEVSLTDEEFDYVVEDLWDAIWREMREGSIYETIDDVDMVELIDASDNPTHDLCYKLMGLSDDEEEFDESVNKTRNVKNKHESKKLIRESIQGSDEAMKFAREYILDLYSWNDYDVDETDSEFSVTLWCGDEWEGEEYEVQYKMSIEKLVELKDDQTAFEEYINSCENSRDYEAAGDEFYRRAEEELEKHFNCTGAFLEPSTQLGQGRTFLFADDMRFDGSFDFQTGEDYIREDNFEGFLELCKDSFTVVTEESLTEDYEIYELPDKQLANYINELDNACYSVAQKELVFDECSTRINDKGVITITFSDKYRSTYGEGTIETLKRNAQNSADKLKQAAESFLESNSANPLNNRITKITTHSNATQYHSAQYICVVKKTFGIKIYTDITNQNFPVRVDPKQHIKQLISYLEWPSDCLQATGGILDDSILSFADTVRRGSYYCLRISARSSYRGADAFDTIKPKIQKFIDENNLSRSYIDTKLHYDHLYVYIQSA